MFTLSRTGDENEAIRKIAVNILGIQGKLSVEEKKKRIAELIQEMQTSSHERRISAIKQLSTFSDGEVVLALMEAIRDDSTDIRRASAESLRRINSLEAIPALIELRDDLDAEVRETAEFACKQLLKGLMSYLILDIDKRKTAARYLPKFGAFAVNPLLIMLRDAETIHSERAKPTEIRSAIIDALSKINDPHAVDLLTQALKNKNDLIVWGAAKALGAIGDASVIGPLEEALVRWYDPARKLSPTTYVWMTIKDALKQLNA